MLLAAVWHAAAIDARLRKSNGESLLRSLELDDQDHRRDMLFFLLSRAWRMLGEGMDIESTLSVKAIVRAWHRKVTAGKA